MHFNTLSEFKRNLNISGKKVLGGLSAALFTAAFLCVAPANAVYAGEEDRCGLIELPDVVEVSQEDAGVYEDSDDTSIAIASIYADAQELYWGKYAGWYYYNQLSDKYKAIWDAYYEVSMAVFSINDTIEKTSYARLDSSYQLNRDDVVYVRNLFYYANPQFYFLKGSSSYTRNSDGYVTSVSLGIADDFRDGDARQAATASFKSKLDEWVSQVSTGKYDEDKVKIAHDIIVNNTVYDKSASDNQSSYSMVVNGKTVCAGYAGAMQLLLNASGVDTIEVTSDSHGWNMVKLHDTWYVIDATWDDTDNDSNPAIYTYYNKSLTTVLSNDSKQAHEMRDWYTNIAPSAPYDSISTGQTYSSAYFTVDNYVYFKVNDNSSLATRMVKVIDTYNGAVSLNAPKSVNYDSNDYTVDGTASSGSSGNNSSSVDTSTLDLKWSASGIYWYEGGVKQGTYDDPKGVLGYGTVRGREIWDPESDAWYWLDACYDGAKAVSKEVWMPYVYQDEANWRDNEEELQKNINESGTMAEQIRQAIINEKGKWVRYDSDGAMIKGWYNVNGNIYYYDQKTGAMAKGIVEIEGRTYIFDETTGIRLN